MSLFNWFSAKPNAVDNATSSAAATRDAPLRAMQAMQNGPGQMDASNRSDERKVKRHARREQLYVAVREAMTHSGVLSASYKFKVLSLDQRGDQFLVMMDVDQSVDSSPENLTGIESKIVQTAKARFEMLVSAVYWRIDTRGAPLTPKSTQPASLGAAQTPMQTAGEYLTPAARKPPTRYEPIQDEEVAAFKQALAAASAVAPAASIALAASPSSSPSTTIEPVAKSRPGPRSYTLLTGFEDTEMPESYTAPVLSNTQYGDLN